MMKFPRFGVVALFVTTIFVVALVVVSSDETPRVVATPTVVCPTPDPAHTDMVIHPDTGCTVPLFGLDPTVQEELWQAGDPALRCPIIGKEDIAIYDQGCIIEPPSSTPSS